MLALPLAPVGFRPELIWAAASFWPASISAAIFCPAAIWAARSCFLALACATFDLSVFLYLALPSGRSCWLPVAWAGSVCLGWVKLALRCWDFLPLALA